MEKHKAPERGIEGVRKFVRVLFGLCRCCNFPILRWFT